MLKLKTKIHLALGLTIFCSLTLSPNFAWLVVSESFNEPYLNAIAPALLTLAFFMSLSKRLWVGVLLISPVCVVSLWETWYVAKFGYPSNSYLIAIIAESNIAEAISFLQGIWRLALFMFLVPAALSGSLIYYLHKEKIIWPPRYRKLIGISSFIGLVILNSILLIDDSFSTSDAKNNFSQLIQPTYDEGLFQFAESWPIGLPFRILSYLSHQQRLKKVKSVVADFKFAATATTSATATLTKPNQTIILVIGESSRPDHWSLFGYSRDTNPQLKTIEPLILYKNVISPWPWTRMAVPIIITRKPENNFEPFFAERSIVSAFNEAGYSTAWLSNQSAIGFQENSVSVYAQEANYLKFYNPASYKRDSTFDGVLLDGLLAELDKNNSKKFIVLHTLGSHFNYNHRYPKTFEKFQPVEPSTEALSLHNSAHKEFLINAYDNAILYTDFVLSEVIKKLKARNENSILFYVSDHGETLFDEQCNDAGHAHQTRYDFVVPMFIWYSEQYQKLHLDKINNAKKNADKPLSTTQLFQSILDAAEIKIKGEDLSKSIFSDYFKLRPRWIMADKGINFDQAQTGKNCQLIKKQ